MSQVAALKTRERGIGVETEAPPLRSLASLLTGVAPVAGDPVALTVPSYRVRDDENAWENLLADPGFRQQRRGLLAHVKSLLALNEAARSEGVTLEVAARREARRRRECVESAWASLLDQNRRKEEAVRYVATFFSNLQSSASAMRGKVFTIDATAPEIASDAGRKVLAAELAHYVNRPDPRRSRGYLLVQGWVGSAAAVGRLARVADAHRAILISDAPAYDSIEKLRAAAAEAGLLEAIPREEGPYRHVVLMANRGRARRAFRGQFAEEKHDLFIPTSGPWFGMYLDNIVRGFPWKPAIGYQNPIVGIDDVELDLLLQAGDHFDLYARHRLNPCIRLSADSDRVVVWGPYALSKAGRGVQIGVAIVEVLLVRYAEWIVNQYGLLEDIERAEDVVKHKLSAFVIANSGAGRTFRSGSRVEVIADEKNRCLNIDFKVHFREVNEKAQIRVSKPVQKDVQGTVTARYEAA